MRWRIGRRRKARRRRRKLGKRVEEEEECEVAGMEEMGEAG